MFINGEAERRPGCNCWGVVVLIEPSLKSVPGLVVRSGEEEFHYHLRFLLANAL